MDFTAYLKRVAKNWKLLVAAAIPVTVSWILHLAPPWPDEDGNASFGFAALLSLIALLIPFAFQDIRNRARPIILAAILSICLVVTYATCWSLWIGSATQRVNGVEVEVRFVKGEAFQRSFGNRLERNILLDNGLRMEDVYTPGSLVKTRLALLFSYAGMFFFLTIAMAFATLPELSSRHGRERP